MSGDDVLARRLAQLGAALSRLEEALAHDPVRDELARDAAIQRFEFSYELAWKALRRAAELEGRLPRSPRECFKAGYALGLLADEAPWLAIIEDRNLTAHTYHRETALAVRSRLPAHLEALRALHSALATRLP